MSAISTAATRTVHGIHWKDPLAWMEAMKGPAWDRLVREEQKRFESLIRKPGVRKLAKEIEPELEEEFEPFGKALFRDGPLEIAERGTMSWSWRFAGEKHDHVAADVCSDGEEFAWSVEEGGAGDESYSVCLYRKGQDHKIWSHGGIGPFVAVVGSRCYALEVRKRLVCWRLVSWDAKTGKDRRVHYELQDYRYNLELVRCENNLFLKQQAGNKLDVFCLTADGELRLLDGVSLDSRTFVLGSRSGDFLVWSAGQGWKQSACLGWTLPALTAEESPESLDTKRGYFLTKYKGKRTLWKIWQFKPAQKLWEGVGQIRMDPWSGPWIRITQPGCQAKWWNRDGHAPCPSPCREFVWEPDVQGGCPYVLVKPKGRPRGLFLVGYGAYGMDTQLSIHRWEPLRKRGFIIGILLMRGGGDDSPSWEHSGRVKGREQVLKEAETTVQIIQTATGIGPERTCLFGRSAGGLWAGGLTAKHPKGEVAGFVYMEVPYLDVLRTITNRTLPLTEIETDEFGLPEQRLSDFVSALRWSPMDQEALHTGEGIPGVWQLVRTGMNDSQVYAYESMKWVQRARGVRGECPVWLAIESGQGHFQHGKKGMAQKALDLAALLQAFLE